MEGFVVCECGRHGDHIYPGVRCVCGRIVKNADEQARLQEGDRSKLTVPLMIPGKVAMRVCLDPELFIYGDEEATAYVRERLLELERRQTCPECGDNLSAGYCASCDG